MGVSENPFTPTFGQMPPVMAGSSALIDEFHRAFNAKRRTPRLSTVVSGIPGSGKTCLLTRIAQTAHADGWAVANVSAIAGMLDEILASARASAREVILKRDGVDGEAMSGGDTKAGGIAMAASAPSVTISSTSPLTENANASLHALDALPDKETWRQRMTALLELLREAGTGLMVTVDDARATEEELTQLASAYQHFIRERLRVGLVIAGEPNEITALVKRTEVSFLERAERCTLGCVPDFEIEETLRKTFLEGGRTIGANALTAAAEACAGLPYMMQLVGYRIWDQNPDQPRISLADAQAGISLAKREFAERMLEPLYRCLSDGDLHYLGAMLQDEDESRTVEIADRMGVSKSYAGQYKLRLLEKGAICEPRRGRVAFNLPGLREYLERNVVDL